MSGGTLDGWKKWAPRLVVESVVVVISILLALVVNEWRAEAELTERQERAMDAIRSELQHNLGEIERVHLYHDRLADTLIALSESGTGSVDPALRSHGWMRSVDLVSAAWEAANAMGTTAHFPYETLLALSRAYGEQATFARRRENLVAAIIRMATEDDAPPLLERPTGMAVVLNSLSDWETNLLREYASTLDALGAAADAPPGGP